MSKKTRWQAFGWAWELEIVTLFFFLLCFAAPMYVKYTLPQIDEEQRLSLVEKARMEKSYNQVASGNIEQENILVGLILVGLYIMHLVLSASSFALISTSFAQLLSPIVFASVAYMRLLAYDPDGTGTSSLVTGSPLEILTWIVILTTLTIGIARLRTIRHLRYFDDELWSYIVPARYQDWYFLHTFSFRSLVNPPLRFKVCEHGILIEGWLYVLPISFRHIKSAVIIRNLNPYVSQFLLITSTESLVRIQLSESREPIIISPLYAESLAEACQAACPSQAHLFSAAAVHC